MSLVVWLPLTKDLRQQGLSNVTVTNNGATFNSAGKLGGCYQTDGSHRIAISSFPWMSMKPSYNFSLFLWVKGTTTGWLIAAGGWELLLRPTFIRIGLSGNGQYPAQLTDTFDSNTWYHLGFTWEGTTGQLKLYLNGLNVATSSVPSTANFDVANPINLTYDGPRYLNDFRIYDHCLSPMEVKELAKGLVLHYPLSDRFLEGTTNLVTSITSGGQTTWANNILTTSGTNADTYFTLNLSENIVNGTQYTISCDAEDIPQGTCWTFPLGQQSNTTLSFQIYNGHNEYTFTANNISWGANRCFMDDGGSPNSARATGAQCKIYNFQIEKKDHATGFAGYGGTRNSNIVYDCSGLCNNSILNTSATVSADTAKYTHSTYFGEYNTPKTDLIDNSLLPALTNCTITWWEKNDTTRTLLLTGQTTSHYIAASDNNTYYHGTVNGTKTLYRDGVAGTYKCEAGVWHHYALVGVDISTWTALHLNSYGSYWYLKGLVSDLRIYATALSADDVKSLYQNSAYIDSSGNIYGAVHTEV